MVDVVREALHDRRAECAVLERLLGAVRAGESRALVLHGEPGIGKSALLRHLAGRASGCAVARAVGIEAEMEFAFAGLHQLCAPVLELAEQLPAAQREALRTAFGLREGPAPDRFLIGLAVLGLLAEVAREQPLVCLVDDVQWLDRASVQALAFAARRLGAESVAIVFALRTPAQMPELEGLPELVLSGLPDGDARALLQTVLPSRVDERVRERVLAESQGNPLALLELWRGLSPVELAGGFGVLMPDTLTGRIERGYLNRLGALPSETRRLLLVAAADPVGEPVLVWRAAERLGIGFGAASASDAAGLMRIDAVVRFSHPLVRSAIYWAASPQDRRDAHRVLAEVTDAAADSDRRAWHAAHAAAGPDEVVAADLARSALRARRRGGPAAAAAFLERATELTPDPRRRGERAVEAAQAMHEAGAFDGALRLLEVAKASPLTPERAAHVQLLEAQITFATTRGGEAPALLLAAARRLQEFDVALARETYLEALSAALFAGDSTSGGGVREIAAAAERAPRPIGDPRPVDLLLDGLATRITGGYGAGAPILGAALRAFGDDTSAPPDRMRWLWMAATTAADLWDDTAWERLSSEHVALAREAGALSSLPLALSACLGIRVVAGELAGAATVRDELQTVVAVVNPGFTPNGALLIEAWRGRVDEAHQLADILEEQARRRGQGVLVTIVAWAKSTLYNSMGRYEDALVAAAAAGDPGRYLGAPTSGLLVEVVEAASRSDRVDVAAQALGWLAPVMRASGTDWALGLEARCRALLGGDGGEVEGLYREAVERLGCTRVRGEAARARLLYGEWLRRAGRRREARVELRVAYEEFAAMGMEGFAGRAVRELRAAGEKVRVRRVEQGSELTPQEAQIVRLVREGLSNSEVAARLFLSPRTVEWHLRRIYGKLRISSRKELR